MYIILSVFLTLTGNVYGQVFGPCSANCEKITKQCDPIIADLKSTNRFENCSGKYNGDRLPVEKMPQSEECKNNFKTFLKEIVKVEKSKNRCLKSSDCITYEIDQIPYHINTRYEPETGHQLTALYNKLSKACNIPDSTWANWVSPEDAAQVSSYKCEENMCVPQYSGLQTDWQKMRSKKTEDYIKKKGNVPTNSKPY